MASKSPQIFNLGLVGGGGPGAFFVHPHNRAIHASGTRRIIAGALRSDPREALEAAESWPYPIKGFKDWQALLAACENGEHFLDAVVIVTPNHAHYEPAWAFIEAGVPVFCEKPMTMTVNEALALEQLVNKKGVPFGLAHTYLGHWSMRLARHIVQTGLIGNVRWVDASYSQGWLAHENDGQQATWRTDPARAGISCCGGDIATHALMALRYVTGLEVTEVQAHLETFVPPRPLDDHFTSYCKLSNGGKAQVRASQVMIGHKNDHGLEVNGEVGTIIWRQEEPEKLIVHLDGYPEITYWRGAFGGKNPRGKFYDPILGELPDDLMAEPYLPGGHGEAFHDALARLYDGFETAVRAYWADEPWACDGSKFANVTDGRIGMEFIAAAVGSSLEDGKWRKVG